VAQLLVERLGEAQHVRLRRRVPGRVRHGLHAGRRGDVEDRPATALDHARQERRRERHRRLDQHPHLLEFAFGIGLVERLSAGGEAGVVDQDLDLEPEVREPCRDPPARGRLAQIGRDRLHAHVVLVAQLLGQGGQPILPAGHQDEPVTTLGQQL
jgi:hypothetical protein